MQCQLPYMPCGKTIRNHKFMHFLINLVVVDVSSVHVSSYDTLTALSQINGQP